MSDAEEDAYEERRMRVITTSAHRFLCSSIMNNIKESLRENYLLARKPFLHAYHKTTITSRHISWMGGLTLAEFK